MKKIVLILGHPSKKSFCASLAEKYCAGARYSGSEIKQIHVRDLDFAPFLDDGYSENQIIEPDIIKAQELIKWADHLVFIYPTWWSTPPALMKAFIERTLLPGFAYKFKKSLLNISWDKLLQGKTARIISTMDSPPFIYEWVMGDPGYKMMKNILTFCGVKPVTKTYFGSVKSSSEKTRKKWLEKSYEIAKGD
jgi:NAD(P)H dehydrogenase (quinone)